MYALFIDVAVQLRTISLLILSMLRFVDSNNQRNTLWTWEFHLKLKNKLEPNPLKSIMLVRRLTVREMGGAPRNLAPRNHFSVRIVRPSGCHCTDRHLTSGVFTEDLKISKVPTPP